MPQNNPLEEALSRVIAIDWQLDGYSHVRSNVALLREYLRRAALWAKALKCTKEWPFFDIAAHIQPEVRANQSHIEALRDHFAQLPFYQHPKIKRTCEWYLHWAALGTPFGVLPAPYDPLIWMYERGGYFYSEHGFLNVEYAGFFVGSWRKYDRPSPIVELDEFSLSSRDAQAAA